MSMPALDLSRLQNQIAPVLARCFSNDLEQAYAYADRLCVNLCFRLAHECRLLEKPSEPFASLLVRVGVVPEAHYLLRAVLDILVEEGFLRRTADGFARRRPCPPDDGSALQREARAACPLATPIFELIERCHQHAPAFVTGRAPGLVAIFPRGDIELWERAHTVDRIMSIYADLVPPVLEALGRKGLRVLELGAGVGAVAQRCLPLFEPLGVEHYWFTDVGKLFVQTAQRRHGADPRMQFTTLNIDLPLARQGIAPNGFDVVLGVNVLHVARNLSFSLREIFKALKMSGCVILAEGSPPDATRRWRLDLVFAFLRGWWDVETDHVRPRAGFLLPSEWKTALMACGFDPVLAVPGEAWFSGACRGGLIVGAKQLDGALRSRLQSGS